ncbi:MAG: hypothetical protein GX490_00205 [Bacilli bacterium]|nr:hypothetical protein [Bacilli bacterium]
MKFSFFSIFRIRKHIQKKIQEKKANQDYRILSDNTAVLNSYHHIKYDMNPFMDVNHHEKKYIEDIIITYEGYFDQPYPVHYIVRYPYIKVKKRKEIVDEIIKRWEIDYYKMIDERLKKIFEQASFNPVKNVKRIKNRTINGYIIGAVIMLVLLKQYSFLQMIPVIGSFFAMVNKLLIYQRYYNILSILVYLSIIISMYLIIVKVYFDKVLQYGLTARGFLIKEKERMLKKFSPNVKKIKKHLYKLAKNYHVDRKYEISQLYDSKTVIKRIERFGRAVIYRVGIFISYYRTILLISKIFFFVYLGLIIYLIVALFRVNSLMFW